MKISCCDRIYLDHAATTPLDPDVCQAMRDALVGAFGNPSSIHATGRRARATLDGARQVIAEALGSQRHEVVFTSGGTEANNLAIAGMARSRTRDHVIVSAIEHHAVLRAAHSLRHDGVQVSEVPVDVHGRVLPSVLAEHLGPRTRLVSVGLANNEIGTLQDIPLLARMAHEAGALFHTDAVQAAGQVDINVDRLGVDMLTVSAHKIYGPKGAGALYVREGVELEPRIVGGAQEIGRRAGTENMLAIVGFAVAMAKATDGWSHFAKNLAELSGELVDGVLAAVPDARVTGHPVWRVPSIASFVFAGVSAEALLISLDLHGIDASAGAACEAGSVEPSHVIEALGLPAGFRSGPLRLSLGHGTSRAQVVQAVAVVGHHASRLAGRSGRSDVTAGAL